jgi:hypothetical protein
LPPKYYGIQLFPVSDEEQVRGFLFSVAHPPYADVQLRMGSLISPVSVFCNCPVFSGTKQGRGCPPPCSPSTICESSDGVCDRKERIVKDGSENREMGMRHIVFLPLPFSEEPKTENSKQVSPHHPAK